MSLEEFFVHLDMIGETPKNVLGLGVPSSSRISFPVPSLFEFRTALYNCPLIITIVDKQDLMNSCKGVPINIVTSDVSETQYHFNNPFTSYSEVYHSCFIFHKFDKIEECLEADRKYAEDLLRRKENIISMLCSLVH